MIFILGDIHKDDNYFEVSGLNSGLQMILPDKYTKVYGDEQGMS